MTDYWHGLDPIAEMNIPRKWPWEVIDNCDFLGVTLTPLQKIMLSAISSDGKNVTAEPIRILKGRCK